MNKSLVIMIILAGGIWLIFDQIAGEKRIGTFVSKLLNSTKDLPTVKNPMDAGAAR